MFAPRERQTPLPSPSVAAVEPGYVARETPELGATRYPFRRAIAGYGLP